MNYMDLPPPMMDQAGLILQKCDGHPLAVSTIGGFLASKPKTIFEWRKINGRISSELETNQEIRTIKIILLESWNGLPYHLKFAFLYLSIFPEGHKISLGRLVKRWIAEGYSIDIHDMTAQELGRMFFDELLYRSMILPGEEVNHYSGKINYCQLHEMIREICISKARMENLIFTLEEGCCLSSTQGAIRHLVISSNWKRDKYVLESILDLSQVRSVTVFGEWIPFCISPKMRFIRVLDLEDTLGLRDHDLDQIGLLFHLKYLSLRSCVNIFSLPSCLGNLSNLQTLDVRGTRIFEFPSSVTKLRKLQHFHATGNWTGRNVDTKGEDDIFYKYKSYIDDFLTCGIASCGLLVSTGPLLLRPNIVDDDLNRTDIVNLHRFAMANVERYQMSHKLRGVQIPIGVRKLKALQTLRHVNIVNGKVTLKDLKELTQLCKLGVVGVTIKNSTVFYSAIAGLSQLRSLSVEAGILSNELDGCLGEDLPLPSSLESLKLIGKLVRVPAWIHQLQNLSKLTLEFSGLEDESDATDALGVLPNLAFLRLNTCSFEGKQLHFQRSCFPSLVVLELYGLLFLEWVQFGYYVMPGLKMLQVAGCVCLKKISGLEDLSSLREIQLGSEVTELKEDVQRQVAEHLRHVKLIN